MPERRWKILEKDAATVGANPCGEIYLKSKEFCNLTEVVARAEDTEEILLEKFVLPLFWALISRHLPISAIFPKNGRKIAKKNGF